MEKSGGGGKIVHSGRKYRSHGQAGFDIFCKDYVMYTHVAGQNQILLDHITNTSSPLALIPSPPCRGLLGQQMGNQIGRQFFLRVFEI